jgi:pimeloyl-ACP methyl ester carboxylesterase
MPWMIVKILFAVLLFLIIFSLWGFYLAIRPFKITSHVTPKSFGLSYEDISFYTQDNILIRGWFVPSVKSNAKTIILLHGYPADKGDILPSRLFLHSSFNLVFFDFRYFGESKGHYSTAGKNEVNDLLAAIKYLKTKNIHEVGVFGLSLGGAVAIMAATETKAIQAIVSGSSYASLELLANDYYNVPVLRYPLAMLTGLWAKIFLGVDIKKVLPVKAAEQLHIPILIIHSKKDNVVPFSHAQLFQKALAKNPKAEFYFTDDHGHEQLTKREQEVIQAFFERHLCRTECQKVPYSN